jgi:hypothetical protein
MEQWNTRKFESERNRFVASRQDHVSWTGLSMIFIATFATTWLTSAALHSTTSMQMPMRYLLAVLSGYVVFFLAVRVWSDFQKRLPQYRLKGEDLPLLDLSMGSEGFVFAAVIFTPLALILGGLLSWFGAAALLEVAFEVAFSGVLVRSIWRAEKTVGNWYWVLLRKTGWVALLLMLSVYFGTVYVQSRYPSVNTATDAFRVLFKQSI